ncbi:MAG: S-layer homology domain-containing protein, partial [Selenomonas bovis]|nr:S-layer homology domain-containing protein [Selenomonas bovis]
MKKTLVSALTTALVVGAASTTFAAANPFSDVPTDHWAYDAVAQLAADGVIEGYGDTTFQGDKNITRYEMAQMVAKAMAKKDVSAADKAMIDKLAAEFSDELNNLGVRVANLEKNADKVKWNGELRYTYHNDQQEKSNDDERTHKLKFRLDPT